MKIWICTTLASFFGPMQGAARLYAHLKRDKYDVSLKDFNQNAYFALLSADHLKEVVEGLKNNLDVVSRSNYLREDIGSILSNNSRKGIDRMLAAAAGRRVENKNVFYTFLEAADYILAETEKARRVLDGHFLDLPPQAFLNNYRNLLCGKAIIDAAYYPAQLDMGLGFHGTAYSTSARDIVHATSDLRHNFLIPYFAREVIPAFNQEQPEVVGISITHTSDFVPALTLARLMKAARPSTHICLGGATLTEVAYRVAKNPALWEFFDSIMLGPGEAAFGELVDRMESHRPLSGVPNLMYKEGDSIMTSEKTRDFDINDACTPEFVSARPGSALPLETASGCYWGKCIFCYYPRQGTASFDAENKKGIRKIDRVLEDIATLRDKYNPSFIGITDSSLHPNRIEEIAQYNLSGTKRLSFSAFIRMEKQFKSMAFCQKIAEGGFLGGQLGLESGSQRVNNIIGKGVDLADAEVILDNFRHTEILAHLYALVGTPGETTEEAQMTYAFIDRVHEALPMGWQIYPLYVLEHGPLNERAEEFGLSAFPLPDEYLSQFMFYGIKNGLSQTDSMRLSLGFTEQLQRYLHPVCDLMDVESHKVFLLRQRARGVSPQEIAD